MADELNMTREEAAEKVFEDGLNLHSVSNSTDKVWSAFSRSEDRVVLDEAMRQVREARKSDQLRETQNGYKAPNLTVAENEPIFGLFAGSPEVCDAIDTVISQREERYDA